MYPSISTSPLSQCCTTAGSRPSPLAQSRRLVSMLTSLMTVFPLGSQTHRNALLVQVLLECGDRDGAGMEHAGGQRAVHIGVDKGVAEMFGFAGTAGGDQRHVTDRPGCRQLFEIVAAAHAVAAHAVEHDFARSKLLRFSDPV